MNISEYLLYRLKSRGVDHVFGIPGDFVLPFFDVLTASDVEHVAACNELNAGYAADGYARLKGLSAVAVTYGPGSFSLVNAVAGAYAERVPMVVICGGPRREAYATKPYLHHILPDNFMASLKIFEEITAGARLIDEPDRAPADIDELLARALAEHRPVYLEIPVDLQRHQCPAPGEWMLASSAAGDPAAAVQSVADRMTAADRCVVLVGHEVRSAGLEEQVLALINNTGLPVASIYSGKADFLEQHPRCIGIYLGLGSEADVQDFVETADVVVWLGAVPSDFNKGASPSAPTDAQSVYIFDDRVTHAGENFPHVSLADMLTGLIDALPANHWSNIAAPVQSFTHKRTDAYAPAPERVLTNQRLYDRLAHFITDGDVVLADGGPAVNLAYTQFPAGARFITSSYWASIGSGLGFTLGACFADASSQQRIVAILGDGSFQMTAQEFSTLIRYGKTCVVFVINNRGYTVERVIHDGPFNDIADWQYHRLPEAFGGASGLEVRTEGDLEAALEQAEAHTGPGPLLIEVHLDPWDVPEAFRTIGAQMGK
jgi:indolepyruvate decarboxylase